MRASRHGRTASLVGSLLVGLTLAGCPAPPDAAPAPPTASSYPADAPATELAGWTLTVYYTAVERFHHGAVTRVHGCPQLNCTHGTDDLGGYPADFVQAVKDEGTGRTTAGRYLNWSYDTGYWIDDAPRDSDGGSLRPFESAAADPAVLANGTTFTIADCGHIEDRQPPPAAICQRLRSAAWRISDEFTPGLGGNRHVDLYIGDETGVGFTDSDWYITLTDARLAAHPA